MHTHTHTHTHTHIYIYINGKGVNNRIKNINHQINKCFFFKFSNKFVEKQKLLICFFLEKIIFVSTRIFQKRNERFKYEILQFFVCLNLNGYNLCVCACVCKRSVCEYVTMCWENNVMTLILICMQNGAISK